MRTATIKGELVKEYLEKFGNTASLTLARKIKKETGLVFDDVEQVRSMIRTYKGANGKQKREQMTCRRFYRDETIDSGENPYNLPDSDALEYPIFKLPKAQNKILLVADAHIPYHSVPAMTATINWGKEHDVNTVFIDGDWVDFYQFSDFVRDPNKKNFKEEREVFWKVMDIWQNQLSNAVFYYRFANHEIRFQNKLKVKSPELYDTEEFRLDVLFKLGERGIICIDDKIRVRMGKLSVIHGDEYKGGAANLISPARWLFNKAIGDAACAHFHKASSYSKPTITEELIACFSIACQCDLHPDWLPNNDWGHGFSRIIINPDDTFKFTNLMIHNGVVQ